VWRRPPRCDRPARILDLLPNEERLLLGTEVKPEVAADGGRLTHLKGIKGVLYTTIKLRETKTYTITDRNPQGRAVLIGHPVKDQFQLVDTTMLVQTARDAYRFEAQVPAAKTVKQTVTEERAVGSTVLLTNSPDQQVCLFLQSPVVSDKVKAGLRKAQGLRREWARTQRDIAEQQRQLQAITEDQTRLRANLREVPQPSPLHRRAGRGPPARSLPPGRPPPGDGEGRAAAAGRRGERARRRLLVPRSRVGQAPVRRHSAPAQAGTRRALPLCSHLGHHPASLLPRLTRPGKGPG
jgi:hypothetical protein